MLGPESDNASIEAVAKRARAASRAMLSLTTDDRNRALQAVHDQLASAKAEILAANEADKAQASERLAKGEVSGALVKRLELGGKKYDGMLSGVASVKQLEDPVNKCTLSREIDDELQLYRVACPIGVIAVIFEARPEAAVQIASLAIKSANAVILKGGREAEASNTCLVSHIRTALRSVSVSLSLSLPFPVDAVQLVSTREQVRELLDQTKYIDLVIPRGSNQLVKYITDNTRIPVMGHADGICSVYVDANAAVARAVDIVVDAKAQYPAVCNAAETLLVHRSATIESKDSTDNTSILYAIGVGLAAAHVQVRCDQASKAILQSVPGLDVCDSTPEDYDTEFLDLTLAVKVVDSLDEAIEHINAHGSGHTDAIVTENQEAANRFQALVDSAGVFHNASTRFADGFRLGFGAEVGVSTHRTHARGPVGLEGLMIYKYKMMGAGHTVAPYADGSKTFTHKDTPHLIPEQQ